MPWGLVRFRRMKFRPGLLPEPIWVNSPVSLNPAKIQSDQSDLNEQIQMIGPEYIQTHAAGIMNRAKQKWIENNICDIHLQLNGNNLHVKNHLIA
jgi:hypothetical protein